MRKEEAAKLKKGDLVVVNTGTRYIGLVLEVESIIPFDNWCYHATLKQPGYDYGFRIKDYDTRRLKRLELV